MQNENAPSGIISLYCALAIFELIYSYLVCTQNTLTLAKVQYVIIEKILKLTFVRNATTLLFSCFILKKQLICNLNIKLESICYLFLGKKPCLEQPKAIECFQVFSDPGEQIISLITRITPCYFPRWNLKKMGSNSLQFCLPVFPRIHRNPKQ